MSHDNQQIDEASLRRRLKKLSAPFHTELESTPIAIRLASGTIEQEEYGLYLERVAALHQTLEPLFTAMNEWKAYGIDPLQRTRLQLLNNDLCALGKEIPLQREIQPFDIPLNFATAVGMMYVLEGSTMGGQVLARKLSHIVGSDGLSCTRYFAAYGDNTMKQWGEFCQFLDQFGTENPQATAAVVLGACSMFLMIQKEMHELS
jgi:heme oxygenase (biliverdin-IX-beta and delta-forming)